MTDLVRGMILGALIALYVAWLLVEFGPMLRVYLFRRRLAAAEARLTHGWVEFRRGSYPPPYSVKPPAPPSPPRMRVIVEGGAPWRVPSPRTRDDTQ